MNVHHAWIQEYYKKILAITVPPHSIFHSNYKAASTVIQIARLALKENLIIVLVAIVTDIYKMGNVKFAKKISIWTVQNVEIVIIAVKHAQVAHLMIACLANLIKSLVMEDV